MKPRTMAEIATYIIGVIILATALTVAAIMISTIPAAGATDTPGRPGVVCRMKLKSVSPWGMVYARECRK